MADRHRDERPGPGRSLGGALGHLRLLQPIGKPLRADCQSSLKG